ncbi:holin [Streptomyces sp. BE147]|uniref:holin n=1 Tax=Streptomyces sp. BE147 TaxID=3002524 RepID=UPI002E795BF8|nr:holin [Streptomyces sp. BE147]MEE1738835.1 holin [Streptomyces sp. BE147]
MNTPVEAKVKAASTGAFLAGLAIAVLNAVAADSSLLGPLPSWVQAPVLALVPAGLAWLAGYQARHTPRSIV